MTAVRRLFPGEGSVEPEPEPTGELEEKIQQLKRTLRIERVTQILLVIRDRRARDNRAATLRENNCLRDELSHNWRRAVDHWDAGILCVIWSIRSNDEDTLPDFTLLVYALPASRPGYDAPELGRIWVPSTCSVVGTWLECTLTRVKTEDLKRDMSDIVSFIFPTTTASLRTWSTRAPYVTLRPSLSFLFPVVSFHGSVSFTFLKAPVGHIYCKQCVDGMESLDISQLKGTSFKASHCPKCSKLFPRDPLEGNIQSVPLKFRPYLLPAIREIHIDPDNAEKQENERLSKQLACLQSHCEYMARQIHEKDLQLDKLSQVVVWRKLPSLHFNVYVLGWVFIFIVMILGLKQIVYILPKPLGAHREKRVNFFWPALADGDSVVVQRGRVQLKEQLTLREGEIHRPRELNWWPLQDSDDLWRQPLWLLQLLVYLFGWMLLFYLILSQSLILHPVATYSVWGVSTSGTAPPSVKVDPVLALFAVLSSPKPALQNLQRHLVDRRYKLRKVFIPQTDSLVHELHALRKEVKEVDAYNAFLLAELERCEELRSAAEEKADLATKKGSYPTAATAFLGILTNIVTLAGVLTALFDDAMRLVVAVVCLIAELVWRLSTRPGECFRQLGHGIWVAIRVTATLVLLSLISVVVTWAVGTASLKIFQLFLEHGCPPLYDLAKSFWEEISIRFIDISATFIKNYIVDFQAYTEPGICLPQDIVPTIGHLAI
ncbi:uncharacterized protein ARMOST_07519 [Armillaria ostoyae]|uniref:Uncharacterized protein n=1 Tax=Armillaria ostoyae TaxID=47428 RepID=A0A284R619_ARMOS|nr:uncharacterized protein ARMOST_07519 [Armillaria ostoyae]